jgi:hypothetical protein
MTRILFVPIHVPRYIRNQIIKQKKSKTYAQYFTELMLKQDKVGK